MTRRPTPAVLVAAALLASVLAGCSSAAPASVADGGTTTETDAATPGLSAEPATGELITGDGYSYRVPEGWGIPDDLGSGFDPDSLAADLADDDGFADNVNVLLSGGSATPDEVEQFGVPELENAGATDVAVQPRVTVAGAESAHLTAKLSSEGVAYWIEQYYPTDDGETYIVTFSFSEDLAEADRVAVAESVLATWAWSSRRSRAPSTLDGR